MKTWLKTHKNLLAQLLFVAACVVFWQAYAAERNIMGFPRLDVILQKLMDSITNPRRQVLVYLGHSMLSVLKGLGMGALLALVCSGLSMASGTFRAIYNLIVSVFGLLPGVENVAAFVKE